MIRCTCPCSFDVDANTLFRLLWSAWKTMRLTSTPASMSACGACGPAWACSTDFQKASYQKNKHAGLGLSLLAGDFNASHMFLQCLEYNGQKEPQAKSRNFPIPSYTFCDVSCFCQAADWSAFQEMVDSKLRNCASQSKL